MPEHFINKCSCGRVIGQCRCMGSRIEKIFPHPACGHLGYMQGDIVWLKAFDNGEEIQPRQQAKFIEYEGDREMAIVVVKPQDKDDDGVRELEVSQIEGLVAEQDREVVTVTLRAKWYLDAFHRATRNV